MLRSFLPEFVLLLAIAVLFGWNAGTFDIDPYSELFHIEAAKEMAHAGRFWIPMVNGQDYLIRPPLWTWIVLAAFEALGVSLWAARLPSVLFSLLALVLTYGVTMNLTKNRFSATFSAAMLGTTWGFLQLGSLSTADILATDLCLAVAWMMLAFQPVTSRRHSLPAELRLYSGALGLALGTMLLLKGTPGVLLLTAIVLGYQLLAGSLSHYVSQLNYRLLLGGLVLIPAPWLLVASLYTGNPLFFADYLVAQPFQRLIGAGPWQGLQMDPLFYLRRLLTGLLPYGIFLPALFLDQAPSARRLSPGADAWQGWLAGWFLLGLIACTLSVFQEPTLMLPFYPPLLILLGHYVGRVIDLADGTRAYRNTISAFVLILMATAVFVTVLVFHIVPTDYVLGFWRLPGIPVLDAVDIGAKRIPLPESIALWKLWLAPGPVILLLGGLAIFILQMLRRPSHAAAALIITSAAFLLFVKLLYLPVMHRPVAEAFGTHLNQTVRPGDEIVLYSLHPDIKRVMFYLDADKLASTRFTRDTDFLAKEADGNPQGTLYGVIREKSFYHDLEYRQRFLLRVGQADWKWDMSRLSELGKLLVARQPSFENMRAHLLFFQSLPSPAHADQQALLRPDPADEDPR